MNSKNKDNEPRNYRGSEDFTELDKYRINDRIDSLAEQLTDLKERVNQSLAELKSTQGESEEKLQERIEEVRDEFADELNRLAASEQKHRDVASQQLRQVIYLIISTIITLILQKFF